MLSPPGLFQSFSELMTEDTSSVVAEVISEFGEINAATWSETRQNCRSDSAEAGFKEYYTWSESAHVSLFYWLGGVESAT